tara:strand:+ start:83 stop:742 length:660 start_codon:yes stop_codon:yes gene_type:complete
LFLINLILILFSINISYAENIVSEYSVSASGLKIGKFEWSLKINNGSYKSKIYLKNSGLISSLYKFKGEYLCEGVINNNVFNTKFYKQYWKTKKKTKVVEMNFNDRLINLVQKPEEKEHARLDLYELLNYSDPITSFINILNGNSSSNTIDGRRVYVMERNFFEDQNKITLKISNYQNIWADHKRSDLKKIEFFLDKGSFFPIEITVYFKKRVFKLKRI